MSSGEDIFVLDGIASTSNGMPYYGYFRVSRELRLSSPFFGDKLRSFLVSVFLLFFFLCLPGPKG